MSRHQKRTSPSLSVLVSGGEEAAERVPGLQWITFTDGEIAPIAYGIWQSHGQPEGTDQADWFEAERRLREERGR